MEKNEIAFVVPRKYINKAKRQLEVFNLRIASEEEQNDFSNVVYYIRGDYVSFILKNFPLGYEAEKQHAIKDKMRDLQEEYL